MHSLQKSTSIVHAYALTVLLPPIHLPLVRSRKRWNTQLCRVFKVWRQLSRSICIEWYINLCNNTDKHLSTFMQLRTGLEIHIKQYLVRSAVTSEKRTAASTNEQRFNHVKQFAKRGFSIRPNQLSRNRVWQKSSQWSLLPLWGLAVRYWWLRS